MMNSQPAVTMDTIFEALLEFRAEMNVFQKETKQEFKGVSNQLEQHEGLLETIAQDVSLVHNQLDEHEKRFTAIDKALLDVHHTLHQHDTQFTNIESQFTVIQNRFTKTDNTLQEIKDTLKHHDDLIETVAREVNSLATNFEPILPVQYDHEERIGRLERGFTRLILKS